MQEEKRRYDLSHNEMRIEIADVKHALHAVQVELNILEEKIKKQDSSLAQNKQSSNLSQQLTQQIAECEKKIVNVQKIQEKIAEDLKTLHSHANDTTHTLKTFAQEIKDQNKKFDELSKIKTTLSSLSKTMQLPNENKHTLHRVKSGETLKKIAELHHTTVSELKLLNQLESDRIIPNQELKLP
jgi:LysM repeat protein